MVNSKRLWNDPEIEVVEIKGEWFALSGWNGEVFTDCWQTDENTFYTGIQEVFTIRPVYQGVGEPDEDGDFKQYDIVNYEFV